jgi:hypothetical protein
VPNLGQYHDRNFFIAVRRDPAPRSPEQVARQRATAVQPLVMNPQSNYYTDPVVVLDFQSLYPSMMIAYNLCYSTCLGRVPASGTLTVLRRLLTVLRRLLTVLRRLLTVLRRLLTYSGAC